MELPLWSIGSEVKDGCQKYLSAISEELDGVKKAKVSLKRGKADVTYDSDKIGVDGLIAAVVEAGYEAKA